MQANNKLIMIVDCGNSYLKVSLYTFPLQVLKSSTILNKNVSLSFFKNFIGNNQISNCYIGTVAPSRNKQIVGYVKKVTKKTPIFLTNQMFEKCFDLSSLSNLNEVGIDILGFAYYLQQKYKKAIGICSGTATFVVGVNDKKFDGVIISPQIEIGYEKLIKKAELIDKNKKYSAENRKMYDFGLNTQDAFSSGLNHIYSGFATSVMNYFNQTKGYKTLCITGGGKDKIKIQPNQVKKFKIDYVENGVSLGYSLLIFKYLIE